MKLRNKLRPENISVACITPREVSMDVVVNTEHHLVHKEFDVFANQANLESELSKVLADDLSGLDCCARNGDCLLVCLAASLTLCSSHRFGQSLTETELDEVIRLQLHQRSGDSGIQTRYDYFMLDSPGPEQVCILFEAHLELLSGLQGAFAKYGLRLATVLPEQIVAINHVISRAPESEPDYGVIFLNARYGCLAVMDSGKLIEFEVLDLDPSRKLSCMEELCSRVRQCGCNTLFVAGDGAETLDKSLAENGISSSRIGKPETGNRKSLQLMDWMRNQYDLYQPVALA